MEAVDPREHPLVDCPQTISGSQGLYSDHLFAKPIHSIVVCALVSNRLPPLEEDRAGKTASPDSPLSLEDPRNIYLGNLKSAGRTGGLHKGSL